MCGICGKYSPNGVDPAELSRMAHAIVHRGPDDEGFYLNGRIGLGNRRLSIIDLEGGRMPLSNEAGTVWITYNGEIYNSPALRHMLEDKGHRFKTRSDTEVILHLYEEWGEACLAHLRGMFAFAIWDGPQQKLFLARDRLGQKPLFYAQLGSDFLFASEIKSILAAAGLRREIDYEALHHYLSLRFIPPPHTMLCQVQKLPPAHYLVFQNKRVRIARYWDLSFTTKLKLSEVEFIEGLRERLAEVVGAHLLSDVEVGAFLSGGMDSSMLVAMMAGQVVQPIRTFAVGVEEQDFNELPFARLVAEQFSTRHVEHQVRANLISSLPHIVWHLDEPSDPIAACMFHAAALAAQHVKVVLGGDGGDELFAGFDRYAGLMRLQRYGHIPLSIRQYLIGPVLARVPDSFTYKSLVQKLRWANQLAALEGDGRRYAAATTFFRFSQRDKQALYHDSLWQQMGSCDSAAVLIEPFERAAADTLLDKMLYTDLVTRLPEHSLMLTDRMTMAHGLEARSPFLDHSLVEFLAAFPSHLKIRGRQLKYALRRVAQDSLPASIVRREKQGFMFPIAYWFQGELFPFISRLLLDSHFVREGYFRRQTVQTMLDEHRRKQVDHHVRLWMLLNLEVWQQLVIEQRSIEAVGEGLQRYHVG